jgi:hypothetical protein
MIRARQDSDDAELRALYTDGDVPKLFYERVLVEDGRIVGHAGIRMVPEVVLALAKGHPAAKMHWLRTFHVELLAWMNETGHKRTIALVTPKIARGFLRRLVSLGYKEGCQSAIFLAEGDKWRADQESNRRI